ncbi:hypothetical protein JCM8097_006738 [Rhodosporidiobolus ruineniae]
MLSDISNRSVQAAVPPAASSALSASSSSAPNNANKRALLSSEADALPSKLLKRTLASSSTSSSSSPAPSSPFFRNSRLDAFDAPSSPVGLGSSKSSLPPSSPSFLRLGAASSLEKLASATDESEELAAPSSAQPQPLPQKKHRAVVVADADSDLPRVLHLERGTVLYFGRKAKKAIPRPSATSPSKKTYIPVLLPKSAKNASRLHASARILPVLLGEEQHEVLTVEMRVTGMNGLKVDGKLYRAGETPRWTVAPGKRMELAFWGCPRMELVVAESEVDLGSATDEDDENDVVSEASDRESDEDVVGRAGAASSSRGRASSPAYSLLYDAGLSPLAVSSALPSLSSLSSAASSSSTPSYSPAPRLPSASTAHAESLVSSLNLDLPGLIASAIVFHPRATVAVDEVIRALLRETGGMWSVLELGEEETERAKESVEMEDRAVAAWRELVEDVLDEEEMFGRIDNTGLKDASGQPIPPAYYYIPDQDSSPERVAALEPFVKRVRGARAKGGVRYFWAKPSLKKNR